MKRKLFLTAVGLLLLLTPAAHAAATYQQEVLADSPMAYWRLGETSGSTAFESIIGGAQNGSYFGGFALNQPSALSGDANPSIHFNGGSFVTPGGLGDSLFANRSVLTVELWIKPNAAQAAVHFFEYGLSGFSLESTSQNPIFYINNNAIGNAPLNVGTYSHLALVMDGTNALIYKDGVNIVTTPFTQSIGDSNAEFFLGSRNGNTRFVDADFDELAIYTTALSPSRILDHYNASPVPEPTSAALLLGAAGLLALRRRR